MATPTSEFDQALNFLQAKQKFDWRTAYDLLEMANSLFSIHAAYQRLAPPNERIPELPHSLNEAMLLEPEHISEQIGEALHRLFPMDEEILMDGDVTHLMIDVQRPSLNWDGFDEMLENPEYYADDENMAFCVMIWSISNSMGKEEWDGLNDAFGWGVRWPKKLIQDNIGVDAEKLEEKLTKAGLAPFMTSIRIAWGDTGNPFYDIDTSQEDGMDIYPPITLENIEKMYEAWHEDGPIIAEAHDKAMRMWKSDPGAMQRMVDVMTRCIAKPKDKPRKSNRLIDILA